MTRGFWIVTCIATVLASALLQLFAIMENGLPQPRPPMPVPGREYVSATRDGQADQSMFYFDLFGFGRRIKQAEVLVAGSSHAEFGIEAGALFPHARAFNMSLGGGESIDFAALLVDRYRLAPNILLMDPFSTDRALSSEAKQVVELSRAAAYLRVLNVWTAFLRDWVIQGFLPRLTLRPWHVTVEQPINLVVVRDWQTADVKAFYSDKGEIFADPSGGIQLGDERGVQIALKPDDASAALLKGRAKKAVVTTIPYLAYDETAARDFAERIAARFIPISPVGLTTFDFRHLNAAGRALSTERLRNQIR
jgi:hypothetical protein